MLNEVANIVRKNVWTSMVALMIVGELVRPVDRFVDWRD